MINRLVDDFAAKRRHEHSEWFDYVPDRASEESLDFTLATHHPSRLRKESCKRGFRYSEAHPQLLPRERERFLQGFFAYEAVCIILNLPRSKALSRHEQAKGASDLISWLGAMECKTIEPAPEYVRERFERLFRHCLDFEGHKVGDMHPWTLGAVVVSACRGTSRSGGWWTVTDRH